MVPTGAKLEQTWFQDGSNLSQLRANLGPCWAHIDSSRPSCANLDAILSPPGAYTAQDAENDPNFMECCSKVLFKLMLSKFPNSKNMLENVGLEANREKTTMKPKHIDLEAFLEPFWPHLGVLGRPLEAILGVLGPT